VPDAAVALGREPAGAVGVPAALPAGEAADAGELFVAEDGGDMQICVITGGGRVAPFLRVAGHPRSEVTGPAFSPDGTRLYFSSQRGASGSDGDGVTYEVQGPFRRATPDIGPYRRRGA
jgi:secreted PhoX family phosphatase